MAAIGISSGILATTYQAQDLKDIHGDRIAGRRTLPIVAPTIARFSVSGGLLIWSLGLAALWQLQWDALLIFLAPAVFTAYRFLILKTVPEDQVSFYWYNVSSQISFCDQRENLPEQSYRYGCRAFMRSRDTTATSIPEVKLDKDQ